LIEKITDLSLHTEYSHYSVSTPFEGTSPRGWTTVTHFCSAGLLDFCRRCSPWKHYSMTWHWWQKTRPRHVCVKSVALADCLPTSPVQDRMPRTPVIFS